MCTDLLCAPAQISPEGGQQPSANPTNLSANLQMVVVGGGKIFSDAEEETSKCQELDGKSLSKSTSQGWGEQRCVGAKKLCLGGCHRSSSEE